MLYLQEAANLVVKKRNLKLRDRELRVFHASRDSTPSKRSHPSSAQAANSPAKRLAVDPRTPESSKRANMKTPVSYQGLRASKSGVQKKVHQVKRKFVRQGGLNSKSQKGEKPKERQGKRPAVAARKAKELKDGGASGRPGIKRKLDSQTPDSFQRNKKVKKFK
jgi:nucleolar protein 12